MAGERCTNRSKAALDAQSDGLPLRVEAWAESWTRADRARPGQR